MEASNEHAEWSMGPFDRRMLRLGTTVYAAFCLLLVASVFTIPVAQPSTYQHIVLYTICWTTWGFATYFLLTGYADMGDFVSQYTRAFDCQPEWAVEAVEAYLASRGVEVERSEETSGGGGTSEVRFEFEGRPGSRVAIRVRGSPTLRGSRSLLIEGTTLDDDHLGSLASGIDLALAHPPPPRAGRSGADGPPELVLYGP